jgi:hypothetical protein
VERKDLVNLLGPLAVATGTTMDAPRWRVYLQALDDVSPTLLQMAVTALLRSDRPFMPKPGEIRAEAERQRVHLLAANPYEPCGLCVSGWTPILIKGVSRVTRCDCFKAYQAKVEGLGVGSALSLPAHQHDEGAV